MNNFNQNIEFYPIDKDLFYSGNLVIMSWVAKFVQARRKGMGLYVIKQLNPSFQEFIHLTKGVSGKLRLEDVDNDGKKEVICANENKEISVHHFLKSFAADDGVTAEILHAYVEGIEQAIQFYNDLKENKVERKSSVRKLKPYKDKMGLDVNLDVNNKNVEIFVNCYNGDILSVGVRVIIIEGVRIPLKLQQEEGGMMNVERFDLFSTLILENSEVTGIQGVFVPAQSRYEKVKEWKKRKIDAVVSATVARSISHNICSHALVHLQNDFLQQKDILDKKKAVIDKERQSDFININRNEYSIDLEDHADQLKNNTDLFEYITQRSELIAFISNGIIPSFSSKALLSKYILPEYIKIYLNDSISDIELEIVDKELFIEMIGGNIGLQAFCAIIENFARNSYKHQKERVKGTKGVMLNISIVKSDTSFYTIKIYDKNALYGKDILDKYSFGKEIDKLNENFAERITYLNQTSESASIDYKLGTMEIMTWALLLNGKLASSFINEYSDHNSLPIKYDAEGKNNISLKLMIPKVHAITIVNNEEDFSKNSRIYYYPKDSKCRLLKGQWVREIGNKKLLTPYGTISDINHSEIDIQKAQLKLLLKNRGIKEMNIVLILNVDKQIDFIELTEDIKIHIYPDSKLSEKEVAGKLNDLLVNNDNNAIWDWHGKMKKFANNAIHYENLSGNEPYRAQILALLKLSGDDYIRNFMLLAGSALIRILLIDDRFKKSEYKNNIAVLRSANITLYNPNENNMNLPADDLLKNVEIGSFHISMGQDENLFTRAEKDKFPKTDKMMELLQLPYFSFHTGRAIDSSFKKSNEIATLSYNEIFKNSLLSINKFSLTSYLINGGLKFYGL